MTRRVDVYVDGSLKPDGGGGWTGGWGAVIAIGKDAIGERRGALKAANSSSCLCEAKAAANAIHAALRDGLIKRGDRVTVWADNQTAVQLLNGTPFKRASTNRRPDYGEIKLWRVRTAAEHEIEITAKWIKGHQPETAALTNYRVGFNRRADRLCGIVTGARKDDAALSRGAEAHRRAVIAGQQLKRKAEADRQRAARDSHRAKLLSSIEAARALEGRS